MDFNEIIYEKKEGIARVTINRPERYNAFTALTLEEMHNRSCQRNQRHGQTRFGSVL